MKSLPLPALYVLFPLVSVPVRLAGDLAVLDGEFIKVALIGYTRKTYKLLLRGQDCKLLMHRF